MGYGQPPWIFKGQALYQLSLVKVEEARKYIPPELPIVNFFGWTLGGFYLARYTDSPAGSFDELVALAGLAWNFPTSCAWAARVYVNSKSARNHGISSVGLPSRLATFKAISLPKTTTTNSKKRPCPTWWDVGGATQPSSIDSEVAYASPTLSMELANIEKNRPGLLRLPFVGGKSSRAGRGLETPVCRIDMPTLKIIFAPQITMFLPSFSGATPDHPGLLKYSIKLQTKIKFCNPLKVTFPKERSEGDKGGSEVLDAVLGGRPLICMVFDNMEMLVQAPEPLEKYTKPLNQPLPQLA